jgi:ribosomal-protein-serine acetyltransferase
MLRLIVDPDTWLALREEKHALETLTLIEQHRAYLQRWLPWVEHVHSLTDTLRGIRLNQQQYHHKLAIHLGIWHQDLLAGMIGFHTIDHDNRRATLGYWLAANHQHQGIMTRSVARLLDYAFTEMDIHRVEIRSAVANQRSRNIPRRLGFAEEGTLRQCEWIEGGYTDHVVYSMLRPEWLADRQNRSRVPGAFREAPRN